MTKLYVLDLSRYRDGGWQQFLPMLPVQRRRQVESCRFEVDQCRLAGAGWLLQQALEKAGVPLEEQVFEKNQWGKPALAGRDDVFFNLSHSGNWAVCAVSDRPVGVDVELPRCSLDLARRFFRSEELEGLEQMDWQARRIWLNRLWTAKEAFVKTVGKGISMGLNTFGVELTKTEARLVQDLLPGDYVLHEYTLHPCRMCLCAAGDRPEPEFVRPDK